MIEPGKTYVVMGLLDSHSIAFAAGRAIESFGGRVVYTMQSPVLKKRYLDADSAIAAADRAEMAIRFCDVSREEEVRAVFGEVGSLAGVVHSIAYANPKTCLGDEFHTDAVEDITRSYQVSCVSLATVTRHAVPHMKDGGAVVALSFDSHRAFPHYNWMGVHKAALESLVRALARRHGRDGVRINAVSAGPLATTAAGKIPGFEKILEAWADASPVPWDPVRDRQAVAEAVVFLLGRYSAKITGQVLAVDGGASAVGGRLLDFERNPSVPDG